MIINLQTSICDDKVSMPLHQNPVIAELKDREIHINEKKQTTLYSDFASRNQPSNAHTCSMYGTNSPRFKRPAMNGAVCESVN